MSTVKRQLQSGIAPQTEEYAFQHQLQTIGMRVRKSVADGYQTPDNLLAQTHARQEMEKQINQINEYEQRYTNSLKRVALPSNVVVPPLLSNSSSSMSTFGSNLEEWESNLDTRLNNIEDNLVYQKDALSKRRFEAVDNDW